MQKKRKAFIPKGISQDLSDSKANESFAFSALNMRISVNKDNNLLSITNERGTLDTGLKFKGEVLGYNTLHNHITFFTTEDSPFYCEHHKATHASTDRIYTLKYDENENLSLTLLYEGFLNFNSTNWIETVGVVESNLLYSIYWVDGRNPLSKINSKYNEYNKAVGKPETLLSCKDNVYIRSTDSFEYNEEITIEKVYDKGSFFHSGIVQYAFTYFNLNGRETSVFYYSPINYLTFNNRGGNPEERVTSSFNITVKNLSPKYDYIRVYSIVRTTINGTPIVSKVKDVNIQGLNEVEIYDNNKDVTSVDSTLLLYLESNNIIANTITQKDNTLFLGNYTLDQYKETLPISNIQHSSFLDPNKKINKHKFMLDLDNSKITYFKERESYKLGVVFRRKDGTYSNVHNLGTYSPDKSYKYDDTYVTLSSIRSSFTIDSSDYIQAIPVIVPNSPNERKLVAQGFLNPTVYTLRDREDNNIWAFNSWFIRPNIEFTTHEVFDDGSNYHYGILVDELPIGSPEFRHGFILPSTLSLNCEFPNYPLWGHLKLPRTHFSEDIKSHRDPFIVDRNVVSFYASKLDELSINLKSLDVYLTGLLPITKIKSSYNSILDGSPNQEGTEGFIRDTSDYDKTLLATAGYLDHGGPEQDVYAENHEGDNDVDSSYAINLQYRKDVGYNYHLIPENPYSEKINTHYVIAPWHHASYIAGRSGCKIKTKRLTHFYYSDHILPFGDAVRLDCELGKVLGEDIPNAIGDTTNRIIKAYANKLHSVKYLGRPDYPIIGIRYGNTYSKGRKKDKDIGDYDKVIFDRHEIKKSYYKSPASKFLKDLSFCNMYNVNRNSMTQDFFSPFGDTWIEDGTMSYLGDKGLDYGLWDGSALNLWPDWTHKGNGIYLVDYACFYTHNLEAGIKYEDYALFDYFDSSEDSINRSIFPVPIKDRGPHERIREERGYFSTASPAEITYKNDISIGVYLKDKYLPDRLYFSKDRVTSEEDYAIFELLKPFKENKMYRLGQYIIHNRESRSKAFKKIFGIENTKNVTEQDLQNAFIDRIVTTYNLNSRDRNYIIDWCERYIRNNGIRISGIHGAYYEGDTDPSGRKLSPVSITTSSSYTSLPYLFMAEIRNKDYKEMSEKELESSIWFIAGEPSRIEGNNVSIVYNQGDFFLGKSRHTITMPINDKSLNNVVEIIEYIEETPINIHGYYSKQYEAEDLDTINYKTISNINDVYSQANSYKPYVGLSTSLYYSSNYSTGFLWSKEKQYNSITDVWLNINGNSSYLLDGDKGTLNYLENFNDSIISFQDNGIATIIFNPRVQIPVSDGIPIELGNTMKVTGKKYLSDKIGCQNKWSIVKTYNSLYFIDNNGNTLYSLSPQLTNVSDKFGFRSFFEKKYKHLPKNLDNTNFISFFDESNNRVYFSDDKESLGFTEVLQSFESFYSYKDIRALFNIRNSVFSLQGNTVWKHNSGEYGSYYGEEYPWYIEYRVRGDNALNKTFTNLEFNADSFLDNTLIEDIDFNRLQGYTEYQNFDIPLIYKEYVKSNLKKQNRTWYVEIPRENNKLFSKRITNPWISLKLEGGNKYKTVLHNFIVSYYE